VNHQPGGTCGLHPQDQRISQAKRKHEASNKQSRHWNILNER
jgi:hypothetical protein